MVVVPPFGLKNAVVDRIAEHFEVFEQNTFDPKTLPEVQKGSNKRLIVFVASLENIEAVTQARAKLFVVKLTSATKDELAKNYYIGGSE